ncbi:MAG: PmoA family protein [Acidimicrobiia bacterium]
MIAGDQGNMGAELHVDDRRFLVHSSDFVSLAYVFCGAGRKPYLSMLVGPSGRNMLEAPAADHAHHLGIWWGHGDVNGIDFYLELPRPDLPAGRIEHVEFANIVNDPPQFGFTERLRWQAPDGNTVIEETRILHADFIRDDSYTVDLDSTYTATCPIVFGDTKESVLPGIRLAERLTVNGGGTMTNSHRQVNEAETMGQPAAWIDCTTERKGLWWGETIEGIACFDHPDNPHHEPTWFARDYGVFSPFEGHHFLDGGTLARGETLRARHRILIHGGTTETADIAGHYREYREASLDSEHHQTSQ